MRGTRGLAVALVLAGCGEDLPPKTTAQPLAPAPQDAPTKGKQPPLEPRVATDSTPPQRFQRALETARQRANAAAIGAQDGVEELIRPPFAAFVSRSRLWGVEFSQVRAEADRQLGICEGVLREFRKQWAEPLGLHPDPNLPITIVFRSWVSHPPIWDSPPGSCELGAARYDSGTRVLSVQLPRRRPHSTALDTSAERDTWTAHGVAHALLDLYVHESAFDAARRSPRARWIDEGVCSDLAMVAGAASHQLRTVRAWTSGEALREPLAAQEKRWRRIERERELPAMFEWPADTRLAVHVRDLIRWVAPRSIPEAPLAGFPRPALQAVEPGVQALLRAEAPLFVKFCREANERRYWPNLKSFVRWQWGLAGADRVGHDIESAEGREAHVAAFERAFAGVDLDQLDREFWQWMDEWSREALGTGIPAPPLAPIPEPAAAESK